MRLSPETLEAHKARQRERRTPPVSNGMRPATDEEKEAWLSQVSHGFTRGLFHDVPVSDVPLYHNGYDFYIITGIVRQDEDQLELQL